MHPLHLHRIPIDRLEALSLPLSPNQFCTKGLAAAVDGASRVLAFTYIDDIRFGIPSCIIGYIVITAFWFASRISHRTV